MTKINADVLVYIQSNKNPESISGVASKLNQLTGVIQATISPKVKQLLTVKYDPKEISSGTVLNTVRNDGHIAMLVGM